MVAVWCLRSITSSYFITESRLRTTLKGPVLQSQHGGTHLVYLSLCFRGSSAGRSPVTRLRWQSTHSRTSVNKGAETCCFLHGGLVLGENPSRTSSYYGFLSFLLLFCAAVAGSRRRRVAISVPQQELRRPARTIVILHLHQSKISFPTTLFHFFLLLRVSNKPAAATHCCTTIS